MLISGQINFQSPAERFKAGNAFNKEQELGPEQKRKIAQLKKQDQEVKEHERAHLAAGGGLVRGGASYTYTRGPDGRMYAVSGEVQIDVSPEQTPEATIRKMEQVRRAALAPKDPSPTDRAVAARAAQIEARARMEKRRQDSGEHRQTGARISVRA